MNGGVNLLIIINFISMVVLQLMILEKQYHEDLKKELRGDTYTSTGSTAKEQTSTEVIQAGESMNNGQANVDDSGMNEILISRKKRKLIEAMKVNSFYPLTDLNFLFIVVLLLLYVFLLELSIFAM
jgi:pescadillo protein